MRVHGAAHGGEQVRVLQIDRMLVVEPERADKGRLQFRQKVQRPAQEGDVPPDGLAAGQPADRLVDDRLKDGSRQVLPRSPLIDQGLDIGLCEDPAARGDRVEGTVAAGIAVEPCRIRLQKAGHLVDEGAGAPGADPVHPLLDAAVFKIDDLCILAAQLDRDVRLRRDPFQRRGDRDDFLYEGNLQV